MTGLGRGIINGIAVGVLLGLLGLGLSDWEWWAACLSIHALIGINVWKS